MALTVEVTNSCVGHGQCFTYCPEVFVPDEEGFSTVPDQSVVEANRDAVLQAVSGCPERAIEVHD